MATVNRETLLQQLESVQPGLSSREIIEQSSCLVFKDGRVMTYNDEIACSNECEIGVTGAVRSSALLAILRKLAEDELEIGEEEGGLVIVGKRKKIKVAREAEILLPIDSVEKPGKWKELPEDFLEAIDMVQSCAGRDESQFGLTCVHITPDWIEACDNSQLTRVTFSTGLASPILVRRDSIKHITTLGMVKFCETESWIHFKNPAGLVLSCRRFVEDYHDLSSLIASKGEPITIPKGLADAADKASVFALEAGEDASIIVELREDGKLRVKGEGASGWYRETKAVKYSGTSFSFQIAPKLLIDITKKYNDAEITAKRLIVRGGKWVYVSCLAPVSKEEEAE